MARFLVQLWQRFTRRLPQGGCDQCAFVDFFRSNGDGQVPRLHAFCRCPGGPFQDRPLPPARRCDHYQRAVEPVEIPTVGDPTLTA
jgi:hypothetical protein